MEIVYTIIYVDGKPPYYGYTCDNCGKYLRNDRHYRLAENGSCIDSWYHSIECVKEMIPCFYEDNDNTYDDDDNEVGYIVNTIKDSKSYFAEEETEE